MHADPELPGTSAEAKLGMVRYRPRRPSGDSEDPARYARRVQSFASGSQDGPEQVERKEGCATAESAPAGLYQGRRGESHRGQPVRLAGDKLT